MIVMGGSQRPLIGRGIHREEVAGEGRGEGRAEQEHLLLGIRFFTLKHGGTPPPALRLSPPCLLRYVSIGRLSERESNLPASERQTPRE